MRDFARRWGRLGQRPHQPLPRPPARPADGYLMNHSDPSYPGADEAEIHMGGEMLNGAIVLVLWGALTARQLA